MSVREPRELKRKAPDVRMVAINPSCRERERERERGVCGVRRVEEGDGSVTR
jgi:hypothetical protein